jgi:hypothetical protein
MHGRLEQMLGGSPLEVHPATATDFHGETARNGRADRAHRDVDRTRG